MKYIIILLLSWNNCIAQQKYRSEVILTFKDTTDANKSGLDKKHATIIRVKDIYYIRDALNHLWIKFDTVKKTKTPR